MGTQDHTDNKTAAACDAMPRSCMRDRIREVLIARILDDTYPPGTRLKELALAAEFGVSQAPIREALRELEAMGLVISERYRGTQVRATDLEALHEAYELRATLEIRAVELAGTMPSRVLDSLAGWLERMREHARNDRRDEFARAALGFHRQIVEASRNRSFVNTWEAFHWDVRGRVAMRHAQLLDLSPSIALHGELLNQLRQGDIRAAQGSLRELFDRFIRVLTPA
jgi:DNA-binding GntR family transcriptional regulator